MAEPFRDESIALNMRISCATFSMTRISRSQTSYPWMAKCMDLPRWGLLSTFRTCKSTPTLMRPEFALRRALEFLAEKPHPTTNRYYAREEGQMWAGKGNGGWARFSLALEGLDINEKYSFSKRGFDPARKAGKVQSVGATVDDTEAERTGPWRKSTRRSNHVGAHYLADDKQEHGRLRDHVEGHVAETRNLRSAGQLWAGERGWPGRRPIGFATPRAKPA